MKQSREDPTKLLGRLAASIDGVIDGVIDAEMSTTLQTLVEGGSAPGGELAERDLPSLLGRAFVEGMTGRLRVANAQGEKAIYFEAGLPVMASSNDAADRMLAMLVREGVIDAAQHEETFRVVDATGRKVGGVLVDLGFLRSDELLPAVRRHYESIILSLFSWSQGRWQVDPHVTAGPERTRLLRHPAVLVRDGLDRGYSEERIAACLGSTRFALDASPSSADITAHALEDRIEARVPMLFDGLRSLDAIAQATGLPVRTVQKIALTLSCFGVLRPVEAGRRAFDGAASRVRDLGILRERIGVRYALALESDYYRMLGLERGAESAEVRRAHARLCHDIERETVGPDLWHELKEQIETIRDVLDEALRVLTTPTLRSAYAFNVTHGPDADADANASPATPSPTAVLRG